MTMIPNIVNSFSIIYLPEGGKRVEFEALDSQTDRAEAVREAFALWQGNPRDFYLSGNGVFDFGPAEPVSIGQTGGFLNRAIWRRRGWSRGAVAQIDVIDPVNRDIIGCTLKAAGT